jgi:hypothetical protein
MNQCSLELYHLSWQLRFSNLFPDESPQLYQNLSAVDNKTNSCNLDSLIANRLLLVGKAKISLKSQTQNSKKLKYVYKKDILGGEQGTFYFGNSKVYQAIIFLGE